MEYDRIMNESDKIQEYELALAKIQADRDVELAKQKRLARSERRPYVVGTIGLIVGCIALVVLIVAIAWSAHDDRVRKAQIVKECIQAGNIWSNGECLLGKKP